MVDGECCMDLRLSINSSTMSLHHRLTTFTTRPSALLMPHALYGEVMSFSHDYDIMCQMSYSHDITGLLLDTANHYLSLDAIHSLLDGMAMLRLNSLHWHIVGSYSFPLEVQTCSERSCLLSHGLIRSQSSLRCMSMGRGLEKRVLPMAHTQSMTSWSMHASVVSASSLRLTSLDTPTGQQC